MHPKWMSRLQSLAVIPVVALERAADAVPVAEALAAGGLPCLEITFRTPAAGDGLRRIRDELPGITRLAGTVRSVEQLDAAITAGAEIIVSPAFDPKVVERSLERGLPIIPGVATPTELEMALSHGLGLVKLFPAEPLGGVRYLQALAGPYPEASFIPTGGIGPANLARYLRLESVVAVAGTWLVRPEAVRGADFGRRITSLAAEATRIARQVRPEPADGEGAAG